MRKVDVWIKEEDLPEMMTKPRHEKFYMKAQINLPEREIMLKESTLEEIFEHIAVKKGEYNILINKGVLKEYLGFSVFN